MDADGNSDQAPDGNAHTFTHSYGDPNADAIVCADRNINGNTDINCDGDRYSHSDCDKGPDIHTAGNAHVETDGNRAADDNHDTDSGADGCTTCTSSSSNGAVH